MFDFPTYLLHLAQENRLAQEHNFQPATCSGLNYLEGLLEQYQTAANFVAVSDICSETTFQQSGGWFRRRVYTIFILARYEYQNPKDYQAKINLCRELQRQLQSRLLHDADLLETHLLYLRTDDMRSSELGGQFLNGCTGLYFLLSMDEPTTLTFNPQEWATSNNDAK